MTIAAVAAGATLFSILASGPAEAAPRPDAQKWAVLVGVSEYQPPTVPTAGSANDARDMRTVLLRNGWREDHIRVLVDGDATGAEIRSALDWLVAKSTPDSFSVFHYSGHTKQAQSGFDDGDAEEWDEFLWSVDNQFISDGEFAGWMRRLQGNAWINVSNCEAAGFDDGVSAPNRLFTAASQEDEKGYERYDTKRSIYTGLLTDAFLNGRGDSDRDKTVSIQEAFAYAAENAPRQSANGEHGPQTPYSAGGDGSQWRLGPAAFTKQTQGTSLVPPGLLPPELLRLIPPGLLPPGILPPIAPQTP
jgi:hypothetical protein